MASLRGTFRPVLARHDAGGRFDTRKERANLDRSKRVPPDTMYLSVAASIDPDAVRPTRPTPAAWRPVRFLPRRRHRPGSGARHAVRPAARSRSAWRRPAPATTTCRSRPFSIWSPASSPATCRRFRSQQDSVADRHVLGRQTDRHRAVDGVGAARQSARRRRPAVSPRYRELNDTADPVALIRNALSAQTDQNAAIVLAGAPANLLSLLAYPDGKTWAAQKAARARIAAGRFDGTAADPVVRADVAGFRKLLADWPAPIVMAGLELNEALPFPGASVDTIHGWAPNHPVVDAYRAFKPMPYDAPSRALAAMLHAAKPGRALLRPLGARDDHGARRWPHAIHAVTGRQASLL